MPKGGKKKGKGTKYQGGSPDRVRAREAWTYHTRIRQGAELRARLKQETEEAVLKKRNLEKLQRVARASDTTFYSKAEYASSGRPHSRIHRSQDHHKKLSNTGEEQRRSAPGTPPSVDARSAGGSAYPPSSNPQDRRQQRAEIIEAFKRRQQGK